MDDCATCVTATCGLSWTNWKVGNSTQFITKTVQNIAERSMHYIWTSENTECTVYSLYSARHNSYSRIGYLFSTPRSITKNNHSQYCHNHCVRSCHDIHYICEWGLKAKKPFGWKLDPLITVQQIRRDLISFWEIHLPGNMDVKTVWETLKVWI